MSGQGKSTRLAKLDLTIRAQRRRVFGDAVSSPNSWDIILVLYVADAEGERLTGRETIQRAGGSLEVGKRWIAHLSRSGVIVGDGSGQVDDVVTLAPESVTLVEEMIERVWKQIQAV